MSNIKQLDELREYITADEKLSWDGHKTTWVRQDSLLIYLDAIEREVSERFMELPVDMDGVPIHYGDFLSYCGEHGGTVTCKVSNMEYRERSYGEADWLVNAAGWVFPGDTAHVNPRTIEDVLYDVMDSYASVDSTNDTVSTIVERYADEIRELMGVGE